MSRSGTSAGVSPGTSTSTASAGRARSQLLSLAKIAVFDIGGPLVAFSLLRSAGWSTVSSLILSGIFPALGVAAGIARDKRVDAVGGLVLAGIAVRVILGLATGSARIVLLEDAVPTTVFGALCLGSLWSSRPLMFRFAYQFIGEDTAKGRDFASRWQYPGFRSAFRLMTVVWGLGYLAEAAAHIVIIETTTAAGTALVASKALPYAVTAALVVWTVAYSFYAKAKGERLAAEAQARAAAQPQTSGPDPDPAPLA